MHGTPAVTAGYLCRPSPFRGLQIPIAHSDPWRLLSVFLHTAASHWVLSLFGTVNPGGDGDGGEDPSRTAAVCDTVRPSVCLAAATASSHVLRVTQTPFSSAICSFWTLASCYSSLCAHESVR